VRDRLSNLDAHKSIGADGIHPRVLRELADVVAEPLSIILERSHRTGEVPEGWRKANVTPIFKKGQEGGPSELQASQPYRHPGKDDAAAHSRRHHQVSGGKEGYQE